MNYKSSRGFEIRTLPFFSWHMASIWIPETRSWGYRVYLGSDPRKHKWRDEEKQLRKKDKCVCNQITATRAQYCRGACRMPLKIVVLKVKPPRLFISWLCLSLLRFAPGIYILACLGWPYVQAEQALKVPGKVLGPTDRKTDAGVGGKMSVCKVTV